MKIADEDHTLLWLMVSIIRPMARSLSACSASGVGGPPVWSSMTHRMLNVGTVPAARSLLKSCCHRSTRNWSGIFRSNCGKLGMRYFDTAGTEDTELKKFWYFRVVSWPDLKAWGAD